MSQLTLAAAAPAPTTSAPSPHGSAAPSRHAGRHGGGRDHHPPRDRRRPPRARAPRRARQRPVPAGDVLIGETAGEPVAAVAIADGTVVADPFRPTADLVAVVAARAAMLRGAVPARRRRGVRRPAFAA